MTSLDGVALYPIITLLIFMLIFLGAVYLALRAKRPYLHEMEQLPLEDGTVNDELRITNYENSPKAAA